MWGCGRPLLACLVAVCLVSSAVPPPAHAAATLWSYRSPDDVIWHDVSGVGTLLVGTASALMSFDEEKGAVIWKRDDLKKVEQYQVEEIPGTPLLLVGAAAGGNKTKLVALDILTGQTIWETEKLKGATVGLVPIYSRNMVILLTSKAASASKDKVDMLALNMTTGETFWEAEFPNKVDLHQSVTSGRFRQKFDLSGHQDPVVDGDSVYFTYAGLHRFDLATGKLIWGMPYDVTEGKIKKGNAPAIIDGDVIYTSAKGQLRAHDKATGALKWTSKDFGGAVAQMFVQGDALYGRIGGHFFDYEEREWVLKKPLGVVAVDRKTGNLQWRYDKARDGVTNMAWLPDQNVVLIADSKQMIGLNSSGAEAFAVKLEFKNKLGGGAKAARAGMKFAQGGLLGMAKKDKSDLDLPVAIDIRENGTAVVRGAQHILAFDPASRQIPWSLEFPAPGVSGWKLVVMAGLTAAAYGYNFSRARSSQFGTSENTWANSQKAQVMQDYIDLFNKRFTATRAGDNYAYVLTTVEEGKDDGPGIVGVNMQNGVAAHQVLLKMKEPDYVVDELTGRIFNVKDKRELTAYAVK